MEHDELEHGGRSSKEPMPGTSKSVLDSLHDNDLNEHDGFGDDFGRT